MPREGEICENCGTEIRWKRATSHDRLDNVQEPMAPALVCGGCAAPTGPSDLEAPAD